MQTTSRVVQCSYLPHAILEGGRKAQDKTDLDHVPFGTLPNLRSLPQQPVVLHVIQLRCTVQSPVVQNGTFFDSCISNQLLKNDTYSLGVAAEADDFEVPPLSRRPPASPLDPDADVVVPAVSPPSIKLSTHDSCISTIFSASASPKMP